MPPDSSPPRPPPTRLLVLGGIWVLALGIGAALWTSLPLGLLGGAAIALMLVIALMWQSLQHLSGDTELTFEEALSLAAPTAEEEQKRAVLRALKDLEYERSVGKISEADFQELSARYRAEAKRLILAVDETLQERRKEAEALLEKRLREASEPSTRQKDSAPAQDSDEASPKGDASKKKKARKKSTAGDAASAEVAPSAEVAGAPEPTETGDEAASASKESGLPNEENTP